MWGGVVSFAAIAGEKVVYRQNFETMTDPTKGWDRISGSYRTGVSINNEPLNNSFMYSTSSSASYYCYICWGDMFSDYDGNSKLEANVSKVSFDYCIKSVPEQTETDVDNSMEITVFTGMTGTAGATRNFRYHHSSLHENFIFDFMQCSVGDGNEFEAVVNGVLEVSDDGICTLDTADCRTFKADEWYSTQLVVNHDTRLVEYTVSDSHLNVIVKGTRSIPQDIDMNAMGLYLKPCGGELLIDNILLSYPTLGDYANVPEVTLCGVGTADGVTENLNARAYLVEFADGETLHLIDSEGATLNIDYDSCKGRYLYTTDHSGALSAWTTSGSATSENNDVTIDCFPCQLPPVEYIVSNVEPGYKKKYMLTLDNIDIYGLPAIYIDSEFVNRDGTVSFISDLPSGSEVDAECSGTLTFKAHAFGYVPSEITVENDKSYYVRKVYDFARMSKEELVEEGFTDWKIINSPSMSGINNWTGRKRLYYYDSATGETVYPFGFVSEDNTTNVFEYAVIPGEANYSGRVFFDDIEFYDPHGWNVNLCVALHLGLFNDQITGGNKIIKVKNLREDDIVILNKISSYGLNSSHPYVGSVAEYYEQLSGENVGFTAPSISDSSGYYVEYPINRVDTTAAKITVFSVEMSDVEDIVSEADDTSDDAWYNLQGIRINSPSAPGIYIHGGHKVFVK